MIRGKRYEPSALTIARRSSKKRAAAMFVRNALKSRRITNADQAEADVRRLVVTDARVDSGPTLQALAAQGSRLQGSPDQQTHQSHHRDGAPCGITKKQTSRDVTRRGHAPRGCRKARREGNHGTKSSSDSVIRVAVIELRPTRAAGTPTRSASTASCWCEDHEDPATTCDKRLQPPPAVSPRPATCTSSAPARNCQGHHQDRTSRHSSSGPRGCRDRACSRRTLQELTGMTCNVSIHCAGDSQRPDLDANADRRGPSPRQLKKRMPASAASMKMKADPDDHAPRGPRG